MSIINVLYTIIIGPLELFFDVLYSLFYIVSKNAGLSIIFLSIFINIILLPIYNKADTIQKEQNEKEKQLKPWIDHIKKSFKGDERYMILQTYYRQNHYKPTDVLKSSLSLLLQIPFFIAAYNYLSNLSVIKGASFFFINDLSMPDSLLSINDVNINVLPILMTIINIISGIIYLKGQPLKSKIQTYGLTVAFLFVLYNRPSGLVLYWTMNNIFSLIKNVVNKTSNPMVVFVKICSLIGLIGIIFIILNPLETIVQEIMSIILLLCLQIPMIYLHYKKDIIDINVKNNTYLFVASSLFLIVFIGLFIPSMLVSSSTEEFIDTYTLTNPLVYIFKSLCISIGIFGLWINVYYFLSSNRLKRIFELIVSVYSLIALFNFMFFGTNTGRLSSVLIYDDLPVFSHMEMLINIIVVIAVATVCIVFYYKKKKILEKLVICLLLVSTIISTYNLIIIEKGYKFTKSTIQNANKEKAELNLSRTDKNVVVLIFDRAISSYFPYIIEEKPILKNQFNGFTFYPNTISYGGATTALNMPGVYGGYEYCTENLDNNDSKMVDLHNESLKVMPLLFANNDFDVTIFDAPLVNYKNISDVSIYNNCNNIKAYVTTEGMFRLDNSISFTYELESLNRNLFCYSIMKTSPLIVRNVLYNSGAYLSIDNYNYIWQENISTSNYTKSSFINNYAVLDNLINITNIVDEKSNQLFLMYNKTTHEHSLLVEPDYLPAKNVNNIEYDNEHIKRYSFEGKELTFNTSQQIQAYHVNAATMIKLGEWFDYLRKNDIFDNTRIIIVSDHGNPLNQFKDLMFYDDDNEEYYDIMAYNPLLLVKDFYSNKFSVSNDFMSNVDTIYLASDGIIENMINPITNIDLNNDSKKAAKVYVSNNAHQSDGTHLMNGEWYSIGNNIFDTSSWIKIR